MTEKIPGKDIQDMIGHWLKTPVNGYLGSDYGQDAMSLLQVPMIDSSRADAYLDKLRTDVSVLNVLPSGMINLYADDRSIDSKSIVINVAGQEISVQEVTK